MNYCGLMRSDIANGLGIRVTLWCSGCSIHCKGCQNPDTWSFSYGKPLTRQTVNDLLCELNKPYVRGITFTGGNPLEPQNIPDLTRIIKVIRERVPRKDIWLYTGWTLSMDDFKNGAYSEILGMCDFVVDGGYQEKCRDITLAFRGSSNQRIIDVRKSLSEDKIITLEL